MPTSNQLLLSSLVFSFIHQVYDIEHLMYADEQKLK